MNVEPTYRAIVNAAIRQFELNRLHRLEDTLFAKGVAAGPDQHVGRAAHAYRALDDRHSALCSEKLPGPSELGLDLQCTGSNSKITSLQ